MTILYFRKYKTYWLTALVVLLVLFPLAVKNEYVLNVAVMAGIYIILASSMNITNGYTGVCFQWVTRPFMASEPTRPASWRTISAPDFGPEWPPQAVTSVLFGLLLGIPTLRLKGIFFAFVTVSFLEILRLVTMNWIALTRGPMGIPGIPAPTLFGWSLSSNRDFYYAILALDILVIFLIFRAIHSRIGRAFMAIRDDDLAASAIGIPTFQLRLLALAFSTFFCGLAGCFYAHYVTYISPDSFGVSESFILLTMITVGGMGTIIGPIVGALLIGHFSGNFQISSGIPHGRLRGHSDSHDLIST